MAVSRYSQGELTEFASCEESEAGDFLSVFVPYENLDKPREISSEYVDMVIATLKTHTE